MAFKIDEFMRAKLAPRQVEVKVPELKGWFEEDTEPVFLVRGLTGEEFYNVRNAVAKRRNMEAIAKGILSGEGDAMQKAVKDFFGDLPEEQVRHMVILGTACVEPELDQEKAKKLLKYFPLSAFTIAEAVLKATGEGSTLGE